jgi:acetyltransferase-like isoleucine patch superfamily enzyme
VSYHWPQPEAGTRPLPGSSTTSKTATVRALRLRLLQLLALYAPGAMTTRVWLHRLRGVSIGRGVFIGFDAVIETSRPHLVRIGDRVAISVRSTIIAHFRGQTPAERGERGEPFSVKIEDDAFIGPGAIVLPGVTVGRGAVVAAGSVVTTTVAPMMLVQGNPARPVARCGVPLSTHTLASEFYSKLRPIR